VYINGQQVSTISYQMNGRLRRRARDAGGFGGAPGGFRRRA
jgi:hypothetical protein